MKNPFKNTVGIIAVVSMALCGCQNHDLNDGQAFRAREIHEKVDYHFDEIKVDGIEYLILEKDNNNPHEGFGFMAFRANILMQKQDSILAYLKTLTDVQNKILSSVNKQAIEDVEVETREIFREYLDKEKNQLNELNSTTYKTINTVVDSVNKK
jgi:ElaB/YqjD/DUF883 family membrane-anchored ribosome-binding protein